MATEEPFFGRKENIKAIWNEIHQVNSTGLVLLTEALPSRPLLNK